MLKDMDMDKEIHEVTQQQHQPMRPPPPPMPVAPLPTPTIKKAAKPSLWDPSLAQKAVIYAAIAAVVFYPATLRFIYSKIPKFESLFTSYDTVIRFAVLIVAIYAALMFLPF